MNRFFINTPINLPSCWAVHHCAASKPSSLRLVASLLTLVPALLLIGCGQAPETSAGLANQSDQQVAESDQSNSSDSSAESLWRYQNTRLGDSVGDEEIYSDASGDDPLITPIHRRSAHSRATLEAKQINQDQAPRSVTLSIKTDPTHGRYLTISDADQRFDCQPSCEVRARFDTGANQNFEFQSSDPHQLFLIKDTQANRLVDQIKTAKTLQLSIPTLTKNSSEVRYTFDVRGLDLSQIAL